MATGSMENPIIQTTCGKVRGKLAENMYGYKFYYFDGIPYAQPPVGEKRFRAPVPVYPWPLIKDCTKSPNKCLQWNRRIKKIEGSEDCLYLNISVRQLNPRPLVPVMVYIHGGGFNTGDATRRAWAPDYFMMKDVVFITIGYRLGMFGFAHFKEKPSNVADNCGFLDIILALKWIRDNCKSFNGDPDNITLFGHSSGSQTTHMLMQSPLCKGLFHKAILLAGYSMDFHFTLRFEYRLAKTLGFEGSEDDQKALCEFLTNVDANKLVNFDVLTGEEKMLYPSNNIFPVWPVQDDIVIAKDFVLAQINAWSNSIPVLMGSNSSESLMLLQILKGNDKMFEMFKKVPKLMVPTSLRRLDDQEIIQELANKIKEIHYGDKELCAANYECGVEVESYSMYHEQHRLIQSRAKYATAPTYVYRFDFDSPTFNFYRNRFMGLGAKGVGHCDELGYIFVLPDTYKTDTKTPEYRCIEQMIETLYTFARTSDPNNPILQPAYWEPIKAGTVPQVLNINYEWTKSIPQPEYEKCCARDEAFKILNKDLYLKHEVITLPVGQVKGVLRKSIYDDDYYSFEGIPYGQPPVGELRFREPLEAKPWSGVRDCTNFNIKPIQKNPLTGVVEGSEDCLYLNVYAKKLQSATPLPVMVWLYGGSFLFGEATRNFYSPDYFMSEDVIMVTLNYRLCSLGFLSVEDPAVQVPGNAGLKDQILALKWVNSYIQHFNGDPNNITLFGESAGAASTHFLTATPQTKNLFHKAICMSGTMLNSWSITPPKDYAFRLAQEHGYKGENIDSLVIEYLRSIEPEKLVVHNVLNDEDRLNGASFAFGPCIEPYDSDHCVLSCDPRNALETAWTNDIPIIFSGTSDEGLLMYPKLKMLPLILKALTLDPERVLPYEIRAKNDKSTNLQMAKKLVQTHFGEKQPSECSLDDIIHYYGIKLFWHAVHRSVLSRLATARGPTYLFRFAYDSPTFNHHRKRFCGTDVKKGVAHADDISYLWYAIYSWKLDKNSMEYKTIRRMIKIFVNFAKSSQTNIQNIELDDDGASSINWKPLQQSDPFEVLNLDETLEIKTQPEKKDFLVWDELYEKDQLY
ncbi:uncharacterized protein LOC142221315 [Haematobia irritans]|uniref:uncharacterized protein LOC142221315 n=1 Tax=Haematobia irritans TaxID=7368 RepID=UPI003F4F548C